MTLVWIGHHRLLLARPELPSLGTHVLAVCEALHVARATGARLLLVTSPVDPTTALLNLQSDDCKIIVSPRLSQLTGHAWRFCERQRCLMKALRAVVRKPRPLRTLSQRLAEAYHEAKADLDRRHHERAPFFGLAEHFIRLWAHHPISLRLSKQGNRQAERAARKLGLRSGQPLACLHVRESGWGNVRGFPEQHKETIRNADITTYVPALEYLRAQGFTIVRLGDPRSTPFQLQGVIDFAHSPIRTDLLELWCVLQSRMLIVTASGPHAYGQLTHTPTLCTNAPLRATPILPSDRVILKRVRDRRDGGVLSLAEMTTREYRDQRFDFDRYEWLDNAPEDLLAAVQEMVENLRGAVRYAPEQLEFRRRLYGDTPTDGAAQATPEERGKSERKAMRRRQRRGFKSTYPGAGLLGRDFARRYFADQE